MNYQFIIININNERKQKIIEIMKQLNIINYKFIDAIVPSSNNNFFPSKEYILKLNNNDLKDELKDELNEYDKRQICCLKSHLNALLYCYYNSPYEYNIILEDDVAPLKENFVNIINDIISIWDLNKNSGIELIHIGWMGDFNYKDYENFNNCYYSDKYKYKFIYQLYIFGLQGYIVSKSFIQKYLDLFKSENYEIFIDKLFKETKLIECIKTEKSDKIIFANKYTIIPIDKILNRLFSVSAIVFPPLLIEQNIPSTIGHNNFDDYWTIYFKNYENLMSNYLTF